MAQRYGHTPTDECPTCHNSDSCTHIAGEFPADEALRIIRHNAACRLVHAAIRKIAKGGGALHKAPDLTLVAAEPGTKPQTTDETLEVTSATTDEESPSPRATDPPPNWLSIWPTTENTRRRRHKDVSQYPRYYQRSLSTVDGGIECTAAPPLHTNMGPSY